jgi:hypothetical protein
MAVKNCSLAKLKLKDIKEMWEKYPRIRAKMEEKAEKRKVENEIKLFVPAKESEKRILEEIKETDPPANLEVPVKKVGRLTLNTRVVKAIKSTDKIRSDPVKSEFVRKMNQQIISQESTPSDPKGKQKEKKGNDGSHSSRGTKRSLIYLRDKVAIPEPAPNNKIPIDKIIKGPPSPTKKLDISFILSEDNAGEILTKKRRAKIAVRKCLQKFKSCLTSFFEVMSDWRGLVNYIFALYNLIIVPLVIAFSSVTYTGALLGIEVINIVWYVINFYTTVREYREITTASKIFPTSINSLLLKNETMRRKKFGKYKMWPVIRDLLFIIPFPFMFQINGISSRQTDFFLILLQAIRFMDTGILTWVFRLDFIKKRLVLSNVLPILYTYVLSNHIIACLFIVIANGKGDINASWYSKIPAPQANYPNNIRTSLPVDDWSIYVHSFYWTYLTTCHFGVADIWAVNYGEKIFATVVMLYSSFLFALFFSTIAMILEDRIPQFQKHYENNYRMVLEYIKNYKLDRFKTFIYVTKYQHNLTFRTSILISGKIIEALMKIYYLLNYQTP